MNREAIEQYANGGERLSMAIRGLTGEDLLTPPAPDAPPKVGKWSIQQVVLHVADSELVIADRIKRVISEDNPTLLAFDENRWAGALHYESQSGEAAVQIVELMRRQLGAVLRQLPEAAFSRFGTHSQAGKKTLADLVDFATGHLEHHLKFIHAKREAMGKEMW
jgi:uncharacterized damage-inducible protein DinB